MADLTTLNLNRLLGSTAIRRAADGSKAIRIRCTDSDATSGTVDVTSATQMGLIYDGTTSTTIVLSSSATTLGTLVDYINNQVSDFEAVAIDGLCTDSVNAKLLPVAATACTGDDGYDVKWDTSLTSFSSVALTKAELPSKGGTDANAINAAQLISAKGNHATGTATVTVYADNGTTAEAIWQQALTPTNTIEQDLDFGTDRTSMGIFKGKGYKTVAVLVEQTAGTVGTIQILGSSFNVEPL